MCHFVIHLIDGKADKLVSIKICKSSTDNPSEMAQFLHASKHAIHLLADVRGIFEFKPFKDFSADWCYKKFWIYRSGNKVFKFYDTECHTGKPNKY